MNQIADFMTLQEQADTNANRTGCRRCPRDDNYHNEHRPKRSPRDDRDQDNYRPPARKQGRGRREDHRRRGCEDSSRRN